jgi:hypothetical protein
MKLCSLALFVAAVVWRAFSCHAFIPTGSMARRHPRSVTKTVIATTHSPFWGLKMSDFSSDFPSAIPEAPEMTMREFLEQSADRCLSNIQDSLGEGVEAIPELAALRKVREDTSASNEDLSVAIYELMIERGMTYEEDPDSGVLTKPDFDIAANLDAPEVMDEFLYLYKYGMSLITRGFVSVESVKKVVQERLITRTGKTPEEFDEWLGF